MEITAKDIAKKLGVSPSAVSLAMNGKPGISIATREKILAEAVRLGYSITRKEASSPIQNIRYVIFLEGGATVKETSFYSIVLQGVEATAKENGCNVLISYFYSSGDWAEQIAAVCKDVAGLIILSTEVEDRHIEKALIYGVDKLNIPVVLVDNATSLVDVDCVVADNLTGASRAVSFLFDKGHPDVGYLRSKERIDSFDERQAGFLKARKAHGISVQPMCIDVDIASEKAFYDMCAWLDGGGKPLSAFFADNDIIAAACIRALKAKGYRVPEDVSVVGFDDMPVCTMIDPTLTTIRIMKEQLGVTAMNLLNQRIAERERGTRGWTAGAYRTTISTRLVERESVASYHTEAPDQNSQAPIGTK